MSNRERLGLLLFVVGVAAAPFGYWVNEGWYLVAAALASPGLVLMMTPRVWRSRFHETDHLAPAEPPPGPHELRGFRGAAVLGGHSDVDDPDVHD
jgi:hypothetical protein